MSALALELLIVLLLLVVNGVFSMAEIAVVSARKSRLRHLAESGDSRAQIALELAESPNRFLSTVQVGITLVGVLAAAFSGATMAEKLAIPLREVEWLAAHASTVSFVVVVTLLTYFTLVIGELAPKRIGLANPEGIARALAGPMRGLSRIASPLVSLLGHSTDGLLRMFGLKAAESVPVTEDEVKVLVKEGTRAGVFHPSESIMIERVLGLDQIQVRDLMTPRAKIIWINVRDTHEAIWHKIVVSGHSSFPVYEGNRDQVVGMVSVKSIYAHLAAGIPVHVKDLTTPALVVPATMPANNLLEKLKQAGKHAALAADEFGGIIGLASLHDIMEAIIGELPSQDERAKPRAIRRDDGSWLVDGMMEAADFEKAMPGFKLHPAAERDYRTFAGFVVKQLGHVPQEGESFASQGYNVEVIDMDGHRVDKVLLMPVSR